MAAALWPSSPLYGSETVKSTAGAARVIAAQPVRRCYRLKRSWPSVNRDLPPPPACPGLGPAREHVSAKPQRYISTAVDCWHRYGTPSKPIAGALAVIAFCRQRTASLSCFWMFTNPVRHRALR